MSVLENIFNTKSYESYKLGYKSDYTLYIL